LDNLITEPNEAAEIEAFSNLLNPKEEATTDDPKDEAQTAEPEAEPTEEESPEDEAEAITVLVDGKEVTLTPQQIAESYKAGLRQDDYTRKTQEVAEERKQAEAAIEKAYQERNAYVEKLNTYAIQVQGALQEQQNINWDDLIANDPVEYLKQQHLFQQRQATLQQISTERQQIEAIQQQEQTKAFNFYLLEQHQALLDKLPSWKDENKAKAERAEIKDFLLKEGYSADDISQVTDYRHVLLIRDAMQFRKLLKDAPEATKRVQTAPTRAERSGVANENQRDAKKDAVKAFKRNPNSDSAAINAFSQLL
jgi:hypothetical protein